MKQTSTPGQNAHIKAMFAEDDARKKAESKSRPRGNNSGGDFRLDVPEYLSERGIDMAGEKANGGSTLYLLEECVFDSSHAGGEAAIGQTVEGKLFYQCFHDSCKDKMWKDARQIISGDDPLGSGPGTYHNPREDFKGYVKNDDWLEPGQLPDSLSPVMSFDHNYLPESVAPWVADIADRMQCAPEYVAVTVMTVLGMVLGRKIGVRPQKRTDWTEYANQWALTVGRPGVLKSPAIEGGLSLLRRLMAEEREGFELLNAKHLVDDLMAKLMQDESKKKAKIALSKGQDDEARSLLDIDTPETPTERRFLVNDTTAASLAEIHRHNHNGLLVHRDEIVSLLRTLDQEENSNARGFYLTGWNGNSPYTVDRIGRGLNLYTPAVCLSLLGSTQPARLSGYIKQAIHGGRNDDGLIQRFGLLVWPDVTTWKDVDRFPDTEAKNQAYEALKHLDTLEPHRIKAEQDMGYTGEPDDPPYLRFSPDALGLFREWRKDLERRISGDELHPAIESHLAKYRKLVPSLALITAMADRGIGSVDKTSLLKALAWAEYLETHAIRAYKSVVMPDVATAHAILKRIHRGDLKQTFSSRDVWRPGWAGLSDSKAVKAGLDALVSYDWLAMEVVPTKGKPKSLYIVNPRGVKK